MDILQGILTGFSVALQLENVLFCLLGVVLGTFIGMLPGLGSASGVAVMLPLTLTLDPVTALIMLAGIYYGTEYGATISAVLISTPGDGASMVTVIDGHKMALMGRAGQALAVAAIASFGAGTFTVLLMSVLAPAFAAVALNFGPPEMFALMVLGLLTVGGIVGRNPLKGVMMAVVGAMIAMVGIDTQTSVLRYIYDFSELYSGVSLVAVVVGIVALAGLVSQGASGHVAPIRTRFRDMTLSRKELRTVGGSITRGGLLGFLVGILPGAGPTLASFFAYGVERRAAKDRSMFGHGDIRGVAAPEAANNAAVNGAFIPTLTMGIPGSATTAILLGAFVLFDIQPGPLLFEQQPDVVWGLIASFYLGNILLLVLNLPLAPVFASVLRIRYSYLYPVVSAVSVVAAFAVSGLMFDAWLALGLALFGIVMRQQGYPVAPLVLGLVLGGMLEAELRRSLAISGGSFGIFAERPIAIAIFVLGVALVAVPAIVRTIRRRSVTETVGV
ncbi:tripartite tricarboxylate transporter permease [Georgenia alba]|uniref:Tripartite tricarboxylate transporter permease n=1 Tax=Georgenia alba TaxID=2233858 RepID=A0ABW2Q895_9MICO